MHTPFEARLCLQGMRNEDKTTTSATYAYMYICRSAWILMAPSRSVEIDIKKWKRKKKSAKFGEKSRKNGKS